MKKLKYICLLVLVLVSQLVQSQTTIVTNFQVKSALGNAPLQVLPLHAGLSYFDVNGMLRSSDILSATTGLSFANIAALSTARGISGGTVSLRGFYTPNDGGSGAFYWDDTATSIVQGVSIAVSGVSVGRWKRVLTGSINVRALGAYADGTHDDAPVFNLAYSLFQNRYLYIPAGTYRTASQISVGNGVKYIGEGSDQTTIISDVNVQNTFFIGNNISNVVISGLKIVNLNPARPGVHTGNCIEMNMDTLFTGNSSYIDSNILITRNELTGSSGGTNGVILIAHRSGFGGTSHDVEVSHNNIHDMGASGVGVLGENTVEWMYNFTITDNIIRNVGLVDTVDGFGVSISGLSHNMVQTHNTISSFYVIGNECTGCNYSTTSYNTYSKARGVTPCPFTFNTDRTNKSAIGNTAEHNITLDTLHSLPYFINQIGLNLSYNRLNSDSMYLLFDSVRNSKITGDAYVNTGHPLPVIYYRHGVRGVQWTDCDFTGNPSANQIILVTDSCYNNQFVNSAVSGTTDARFILNYDAKSHNNPMYGIHWKDKTINSLWNNIPVAKQPTYNVVIDSNGTVALQSVGGGIWSSLGTQVYLNAFADTVTIGNGPGLDKLIVYGGQTIKQGNLNPLATNVYGERIIMAQNTTGGTNTAFTGININYGLPPGDSALAFNGIVIDPSVTLSGRVGSFTGLAIFGPGTNDIGGYQGILITDGTLASGGNYQGIGSILTPGTNKFLLYGAGGAPIVQKGQIFVGNVDNGLPSAQIVGSSTTQGWLPPRMSTSQKNAISSPAEGLMVYDLTLHKLCVYTGSVWETITSS